jgi:16S rRNA (cytosine1402-N4)-methyltransferase
MFVHRPVMLAEVLELVAPHPGGFYVDGTVGGGGHAEAILTASSPDGCLLGVDRDDEALAAAAQRLARFGSRVRLVHGRASELATIVPATGWGQPSGVLLDFGVSSHQLDTSERGFSFQTDGPLDMRMDRSTGPTAADLVNELSRDDLARVLTEFGEERHARRIATAIVAARPITRTGELARLVERATGGRRQGPEGRIHPATRTFQALRIATNDELREVREGVAAALATVAPSGRVVTLTFHSLEDRLVKHLFAEATGIGAPKDAYGHPLAPAAFLRLLSHPFLGDEVDENPRARSARLRAVERCSSEDVGAAAGGSAHRSRRGGGRFESDLRSCS